MRYLQQQLSELKWVPVQGSNQLWRRGHELLLAYVDDLLLASGNPSRSWKEIQSRLQVSTPTALTKILGVSVHFNAQKDYCDIAFAMSDYSRVCLERFDEARASLSNNKKEVKFQTDPAETTESSRGRGATAASDSSALPKPPPHSAARPARSPFLHIPSSEYSKEAVNSAGKFAKVAPSITMSLMYLARMSRPDLVWAVTDLSTALTKWTTAFDKKLEQVIQYLRHTLDYSLKGRVYIGCKPDAFLLSYADSDLGGGDAHTRSITGNISFLSCPRGTIFPLMFTSKRQSATSSSTTEAETISLGHLLFQHVLPLETLWEQLLDREVQCTVKEDNESCIRVALAGYSQSMRHIAKHHRLAIGTVHECITAPNRRIDHINTKRQRADPLTKGLGPTDMVLARSLMGVFPLHEDPDDTFLQTQEEIKTIVVNTNTDADADTL
jgi:hypothetical protein